MSAAWQAPGALSRSLAGRIDALVGAVSPPDASRPADVQRHLDALTKPPGSLGRLEEVAVRLATIYGDPPPPLSRRTVFLLAGDHGVARRGVSAYPPEVTAAMCRNFARGGAAINAVARSVGAGVVVADFGVDADLDGLTGVVGCKLGYGTDDLAEGPAMSLDDAARAVLAGADLLAGRADDLDLAVLGEMGIGNTTSASALTAALTGAPVAAVVGPGTGLTPDGITTKVKVVDQAVRRVAEERDPLMLLAELGGFEIAGLVGVTLGAARAGRAVVCDGFIATAAALVAVRLQPAAAGYLFAGHRSPEPGHAVLLQALALDPLLELELRLGEGTGGALALPVLEAAGTLLREMATFEEAGIPGRDGSCEPGP